MIVVDERTKGFEFRKYLKSAKKKRIELDNKHA